MALDLRSLQILWRPLLLRLRRLPHQPMLPLLHQPMLLSPRQQNPRSYRQQSHLLRHPLLLLPLCPLLHPWFHPRLPLVETLSSAVNSTKHGTTTVNGHSAGATVPLDAFVSAAGEAGATATTLDLLNGEAAKCDEYKL